MRIAIIGGSFNPLHIGHAMLADTAVTELGFDRVLFVPTFIPPHKSLNGDVSPSQRLELVRRFCAAEGRGIFAAEDCEIVRGGVSYTSDTLEFILEKYGPRLDGKPAFILGEEVAAEFGKWHRADYVADYAELLVARRHPERNNVDSSGFRNSPSGEYTGDFGTEFSPETFRWKFRFLENPVLPVSSTEIRARVASGKSFRYLVPCAVFEYIVSEKLYAGRPVSEE